MAEKFHVIYALNGGDADTVFDSVETEAGSYAILGAKPKKGGSDEAFECWRVTIPAGDDADYSPGGTVDVTQDTTLTAQWKKSVTVRYALNGGDADDAFAKADLFAGPYGIAGAKPKQGGSDANFSGWKVTSPAGDSKVYAPGDSITVEKDTTLTAQWKAAAVTVTYALNGGSAGAAGDAFAPAKVFAGDHTLPSAKPSK
ncbi:MAG: InlB B-repeat-containing protein, partial [Clostridiales Family XIII bacterium]|nr:InlB B-repeat-containing protein [Clostridiales Family XIII bacterium]